MYYSVPHPTPHREKISGNLWNAFQRLKKKISFADSKFQRKTENPRVPFQPQLPPEAEDSTVIGFWEIVEIDVFYVTLIDVTLLMCT